MPPNLSAINIKAAKILEQERKRYIDLHPKSMQLAESAKQHFLYGVPMHWMNDWGTPAPLFIDSAQGAHFTCADNITYTDFCLGDSGAMFGHSPPAVVKAITQQAEQGYTSMLPSSIAPMVGEALQDHFGLSHWQLATTATDANRFVLRWARAITKRKKLLVFDGCYHGTVDDTTVDVENSQTINRLSLLGQVHDLSLYTEAIPFNDIAAVERALATEEFACILTEPALTNCGMVLPEDGFIEALRALTLKYGSLLILDETHTISTNRGGWAKANNVTPDFLVIGKPIAGGLPAAAYGFSQAIANRMQTAKDEAPAGHSGIGTTLSGNMMTLAAMHATLTQVATQNTYQHMLNLADTLENALNILLNKHSLAWNITRLGARLELQFCSKSPINAEQARAAQNETLENAIHLYLLNRGVLLTPFHNMVLICPDTNKQNVNRLLEVLDDCLKDMTQG